MNILTGLLIVLTLARVPSSEERIEKMDERPSSKDLVKLVSTDMAEGRLSLWKYQNQDEIAILQNNQRQIFSSKTHVVAYQVLDDDWTIFIMMPKKEISIDENRRQDFKEGSRAVYAIRNNKFRLISEQENLHFEFLSVLFIDSSVQKSQPTD